MAHGDVIVASGVAKERLKADGRIVSAIYVVQERPGTNCGIVVPDGIGSERLLADGRIVSAGSKAKKGALPFCRIASGIVAVRRWDNPESFRASRLTEERE